MNPSFSAALWSAVSGWVAGSFGCWAGEEMVVTAVSGEGSGWWAGSSCSFVLDSGNFGQKIWDGSLFASGEMEGERRCLVQVG